MNQSRKLLVACMAFGLSLAIPAAFAQSAPAPQDSAMQSQSTPPDASQTPQPAAAAPVTAAKEVTWADLDGDKDGKLTKSEVASVPTLSQIFDQADANGDGALTAEEYKAFAAKQSGHSGR